MVDVSNNTLAQLGFLGVKIQAVSGEVGERVDKLQGKLDEIRSYLITIQDALKAQMQAGDKDAPQEAIVQAWMELEA
jgi:hypothetical protein